MLSTQPMPTRGGPWKDICQLQLKDSNVRDKMITGLSMEVGDGRRTLFWEDVWLQGGSLKLRFPRLFSISNQQGSVIGECGFWDGLEWVWNFQWRRGLYQWELELLNRLHEALRPINLASDKQDRLVWKYGKEEIFSTNSFVQVVQSETIPEDITSFSFTRTIWKGLAPPQVELFIWFVLIGRVNTKERLHRFGILRHGDNICVFCKRDVEHIYHLFLGCEFTWQVWCRWLSDLGRAWSIPGSLKEHFESWTGVVNRNEERNRWLRCFFAVIWNIWLERNRRIFNSKEGGSKEVYQQSLTSYGEWSSRNLVVVDGNAGDDDRGS
ncbi:uncharacterized protein LOC107621062 [Arachis ipaensis]|uniref:uncharacterized protein LOC107621062 n=1 Tax=Arachis ipaensis TaxID=130454 RepID=UPI0007AF9B58|nr:uncharacterized protein LOC107621062 [Arachis ipaensis]